MDTEDRVQHFADVVASTASFDELLDAFDAAIKPLGASGFYFWSYTRGALGQLIAEETDDLYPLVASRGPFYLKPLEAMYLKSRWYREDPTLAAGEERTAPFTTSDVLSEDTAGSSMRRYLDLAKHYKIAQDLFVPLHTPGRTQVLYLFRLGLGGEDLEGLENRKTLVQLARIFGMATMDFKPVEQTSPVMIDLTAREMECLALTSKGMTTQEIAEELGLSARTAKFHVENMMRKLQARTRAQAVSIAARSLLLTN